MQKKYKFFAAFVSVATMALVGTGCLKDELQDDALTNPEISASPNLIELPGTVEATDTYNSSSVISLPIGNNDTTFDMVYVRLAGDQPAPQDIQVQLEFYDSLLTSFNDSTGTHLKRPSPSIHTLMPADLLVTIPKGSRQGVIQMKTKPIDLSTDQYGFGLRIKSVSNPAYGISGNFSNTVVTVGVRNIYDGIYSLKGFITRDLDQVLGGIISDEEVSMVTTGPNSNSFAQVWADGGGVGGIDGLTARVDPVTNKVTMLATSNPALVNWNLYPDGNRYDPATRTYYVSFYWGTGPANRSAIDTLTYLRPRP